MSGTGNFEPGYIYTSTNSGLSWSRANVPYTYWLSAAASADGTRLAAGNEHIEYLSPTLARLIGEVYTSTNSGITWTSNYVGAGSSLVLSIASSADGNTLAATVGFDISVSTNGGISWLVTGAPPPIQWNSVACSADGNRLVASGSLDIYSGTGFIYTSTNLGGTWNLTTAPTNYQWCSVASSADGMRLAASSFAGPIITSADGGVTWAITSLTPSNQTFVASSSDGVRLAASVYQGGLYTSTNSGATWQSENIGAQPWAKVATSTNGVRLAAAAYGGLIYLRPGLSLDASLPGQSIPLGGIGVPVVQLRSSSGERLDVTSEASFSSHDTNRLVMASTNGALTGISLGQAGLTVSVPGFTQDLVLTVRAPAFQDQFSVAHDYLAQGVTNTDWDGVYARPGEVPDTSWGSAADAATWTADANLSSNNVLTVLNRDVGWDSSQNDGFFLFKYVAGDFQMAVHLTSLDPTPYNEPGILARAFRAATNGSAGAPFEGAEGEDWISFVRLDEFAVGDIARLNLANMRQDLYYAQSDPNYWLLMVRRDGTNFSFYKRSSATLPWLAVSSNAAYSVPAFANIPMQVGLEAGGFTTNTAIARFDSFMLDTGLPVLTVEGLGIGGLRIAWPSTWAGLSLESTSALDGSAQWQPVIQRSSFGSDGTRSLILPTSGASAFFRLTR